MKTMEGKVWQLTGADTTCGCEAIGQLFIDSAERPRTASATDGSTFVWSVDQQLTLFQGQHTCIKHFQSRIDDVALAPGGLIAVAESRGSVTVGVLQTSETGILFKEKNHCNFVPENERFADVTFVKVIFQVCEEESSCRLMCLSSGGLLLVFRNIRLLDGDIDLSAVKVDKLRTSHSQSWDVAATESNVYTVGGGASCLNVFSCEDEGQLVPQEQVSEDGDPEMRALAVLSNGDALLTMDSKGTFYLFDTVVLMVVHTWSGPGCVDFRIVDPRSDKPFKLENFKLVALVPQEEKVQLLSLPDRRSLFEQRISGRASLGKALMSQEEIFTTEWKSIEDEDGAETTVVYRCYAETNPQQRLLRLIAKKRFAEAQELATMYGLDYNFVPHIVQSKIWQTFPTLAEMEDHLRQCATEASPLCYSNCFMALATQ
ncbi:uncharacterized protein LOC118477180 [Aplysia californica]|uniref:Uncharacterized protein LOC118477180 n=1 Tax=Aplysia californica TaxID=6500 RepID=A0ABM1VXQ7_APLCA|nr:uncharacterized protein LOC118477180 [Aplysia californica]XP_035827200.1 uncharacterized protein LOC118477180 [Aplysia californica]